jgi:hypothetical protein
VVSLEELDALGTFDAPGTVDAFTSVAWLTAAFETGGREAWLERLPDFVWTVAGLDAGDGAVVDVGDVAVVDAGWVVLEVAEPTAGVELLDTDDGAVVLVVGAGAGGALSARARAAPNAASVARAESHRSARNMRRSNPG